MVSKICKNCGSDCKNFTPEEFKKNLNYARPEMVGAGYVFDLWNYPIEHCFNCYYSNLDISKINENEKEFLKSEKFFSVINNEQIENLDSEYSEDFNIYMVFSMICETNKNYFLASTACYKAYGILISANMEYYDENIDTNDIDSNPQRYFDNIKYYDELGNFLINKCYKLINLAIEDNSNNVDYYMFKSLIEFELNKTEDYKNTCKFILQNFALSTDQLEAIKFLNQ